MTMRTACIVAACVGMAVSALAQDTLVLFGQEYKVQRFDYSEQVLLPNIAFPEDVPIPFIESEGVIWLGNNKLLMSADDIFDISPGNPDNWVVEVELLTDNQGDIIGLAYSRTILAIDSSGAFDLNPSGITLNTGVAGLGRGGNVVVSSGRGNLFSYSLQPGSEGQLLGLDGQACVGGMGACRISMGVQNVNLEDVAYVEIGAGGGPEFYVVNQDTTSVERWATLPASGIFGDLLGVFPIGLSIPEEPPLYAPKGIMYAPDAETVPGLIRRPGGTIIVAFDDLFPALQAFDLDGTLLATEILTTDGTPGGPSKLDLSGCFDPLQLESLTIDPDTGRFFLVSQGALTFCNFIYILTPVRGDPEPCIYADFNEDGGVDGADVEAFFQAWEAAEERADVNRDGGVDGADVEAFFQAWEAGGCE